MKKLLKNVVAICSLLAVVLIICNVKVNAEDVEKTWISYLGTSSVTKNACFKEDEASEHYYEFMIGNSSSYADVSAVIIDMPSDNLFEVSIVNEDTGEIEENYDYGRSGNKMIYYISKPQKSTKYLLTICNEYEENFNRVYSIKIDSLYKRGTYKAKFKPSTLTNPGKGKAVNSDAVYSNIGSLDLRKVTTIPNDAELTGVSESGTMSRRLGNTKMELTNGDSGVTYEGSLSFSGNVSVQFKDFRNSYDAVKTIWRVDYYTYAALASTFKNPEISITYRYNQYANF